MKLININNFIVVRLKKSFISDSSNSGVCVQQITQSHTLFLSKVQRKFFINSAALNVESAHHVTLKIHTESKHG